MVSLAGRSIARYVALFPSNGAGLTQGRCAGRDGLAKIKPRVNDARAE